MTASRRAAAALLPAVLAVLLPGSTAWAGSGAPYQDPSAVGYLGFCNQAGQQVTSGSLTAAPFVWRAVSSAPAPTSYAGSGRTAILLAYQPREGVPPGEWSGDELTATSRYSNPAHPMAAATVSDESLADFVQDFPPRWDGYLQIRLYVGAPDRPTYSLSYAATDVQVTGSTWHVVGGGPVSCGSGRSESIESILLPASQLTPTAAASQPTADRSSPGASSDPAATAGGPQPDAAQSASTGAPADTASRPAAQTADAPASGSGPGPLLWTAVAAAVVLIGSGLIAVRRRLSPARAASSSPRSGTAEKGR